MRALLAALALVFAAGTVHAAPIARLQPAPAVIFVAAKAVVAKRCGSRGGFRRTRTTYAATAC